MYTNSHRKHNALSNIQHEHFHTALRNGIPPALAARCHGCLWDDDNIQTQNLQATTSNIIGFDNSRMCENIVIGHTNVLHDMLTPHNVCD